MVRIGSNGSSGSRSRQTPRVIPHDKGEWTVVLLPDGAVEPTIGVGAVRSEPSRTSCNTFAQRPPSKVEHSWERLTTWWLDRRRLLRLRWQVHVARFAAWLKGDGLRWQSVGIRSSGQRETAPVRPQRSFFAGLGVWRRSSGCCSGLTGSLARRTLRTLVTTHFRNAEKLGQHSAMAGSN